MMMMLLKTEACNNNNGLIMQEGDAAFWHSSSSCQVCLLVFQQGFLPIDQKLLCLEFSLIDFFIPMNFWTTKILYKWFRQQMD
jgi:hypothetical protein